jgi:hypothetical protein
MLLTTTVKNAVTIWWRRFLTLAQVLRAYAWDIGTAATFNDKEDITDLSYFQDCRTKEGANIVKPLASAGGYYEGAWRSASS